MISETRQMLMYRENFVTEFKEHYLPFHFIFLMDIQVLQSKAIISKFLHVKLD